MSYRVLKPYTSYYYRKPITIPAGTLLEWFPPIQCYLSPDVDGYRVPVSKWAIESWKDYFEEVVNA